MFTEYLQSALSRYLLSMMLNVGMNEYFQSVSVIFNLKDKIFISRGSIVPHGEK